MKDLLFITTHQALLVRTFSHCYIYWIHASCKLDRTKNRHKVIRDMKKK